MIHVYNHSSPKIVVSRADNEWYARCPNYYTAVQSAASARPKVILYAVVWTVIRLLQHEL